MPAIELDGRFEKTVLWVFQNAGEFGQPKHSTPVEIMARWDGTTREVKGPGGTPVAIDSELIVDREIPIESLVWKGPLASLPSPVTNVMQVITTDTTRDVKNRAVHYVASLMRYGNALPS